MKRSSIMQARVGGLASVKQKGNKTSPQKKGYYAFIWPNIEPFLLGSTDARGIAHNRVSRLTLLQKGIERLRQFEYEGYLWTHIDMGVHTLEEREYWYLTHSSDLNRYVQKVKAREMGEAVGMGFPAGYTGLYSKDHWEVFVPAHSKTHG